MPTLEGINPELSAEAEVEAAPTAEADGGATAVVEVVRTIDASLLEAI